MPGQPSPPPQPPGSAAPDRSARTSLALTREVTCIRSLAWRTDLPLATNWQALGAALEAGGLTRLAPIGTMQRFGTASGDELALLPASGRVQFRVHYSVPEHERRFAAERLFRSLVYALIQT
jgi:hypothetical protein